MLVVRLHKAYTEDEDDGIITDTNTYFDTNFGII